MTPAEIIAEARPLLQDTTATYRYSDTVLLGFVNDVLKRCALFRPDLFTTIGNVTPTADTSVQTLPSGAVRLIEIYQVSSSPYGAVTEVAREMLDRNHPGWRSEASGTPVNYVRHARNPDVYFLYPPPATGTTLLAEYSATPATYTINQTIAMADVYFPVMVDGVVWLAESVDNEHVNSGRAKMFYDSFIQGLGVEMNNRAITDREDAAVRVVSNQPQRGN